MADEQGGQRFKTGYLAPNINYGAIGQQVGAAFAGPIAGVLQERAQKREAEIKAMNPDAAFAEGVSGSVSERYKSGLQMSLDIYREAATAFKSNPNAENKAAFQAARQQYTDIKNDATFGSKHIAEQGAAIRQNNELIEQGLMNENLNALDQYSMPQTYERVGNTVHVVTADGSIPYFQSGVSASNADNLFYPIGSTENAYKFWSDKAAGQVWEDNLSNEATLSGFYKTNADGQIIGRNEDVISEAISREYNAFGDRNKTMWNAAAAEGYKDIRKKNQDLNNQDLQAIETTFHPEFFSLTNEDGVSVTKITGFDNEGNPQYAVSLDEFEQILKDNNVQGDVRQAAENFRAAETVHARNFYNYLSGKIGIVDEVAAAQQSTDSGLVVFDAYNNAGMPIQTSRFDDQGLPETVTDPGGNETGTLYYDIPLAARTTSFIVDDEKTQVLDVVMNDRGEVVGYNVTNAQDILDVVAAGGSQADLEELLSTRETKLVTRTSDPDLFNELQSQVPTLQVKGQSGVSVRNLINAGAAQLQSISPETQQAQQTQGTVDPDVAALNGTVTPAEPEPTTTEETQPTEEQQTEEAAQAAQETQVDPQEVAQAAAQTGQLPGGAEGAEAAADAVEAVTAANEGSEAEPAVEGDTEEAPVTPQSSEPAVPGGPDRLTMDRRTPEERFQDSLDAVINMFPAEESSDLGPVGIDTAEAEPAAAVTDRAMTLAELNDELRSQGFTQGVNDPRAPEYELIQSEDGTSRYRLKEPSRRDRRRSRREARRVLREVTAPQEVVQEVQSTLDNTEPYEVVDQVLEPEQAVAVNQVEIPEEVIEASVDATRSNPNSTDVEDGGADIIELEPGFARNPLAYVLSYEGIDETDPETQATIAAFLKNAGIDQGSQSLHQYVTGNAWCGAFMYTILTEMGAPETDVVSEDDVANRSRALQYARIGTGVSIEDAQPGDVWVRNPSGGEFDFDVTSETKRSGLHVGIYVGVDPERPGNVLVLGGNQATEESRGEGVTVNIRSFPANESGAVRRIDDLESITEEQVQFIIDIFGTQQAGEAGGTQERGGKIPNSMDNGGKVTDTEDPEVPGFFEFGKKVRTKRASNAYEQAVAAVQGDISNPGFLGFFPDRISEADTQSLAPAEIRVEVDKDKLFRESFSGYGQGESRDAKRREFLYTDEDLAVDAVYAIKFKETGKGDWKSPPESSRYTKPSSVRSSFGNRPRPDGKTGNIRSMTDAEINEYFILGDDGELDPRKGEALFNYVYSDAAYRKGGLGNDEPGDGYKYRGRGGIQITGKNAYRSASQALFGDDRLVENPDLITQNQPVNAMVTAWRAAGGSNPNVFNQMNRDYYKFDMDNLTIDEHIVLQANNIAGSGKDILGRSGKDGEMSYQVAVGGVYKALRAMSGKYGLDVDTLMRDKYGIEVKKDAEGRDKYYKVK